MVTCLREIKTSIPYHSPLLKCCSGSCDNNVIDQRAVNDFCKAIMKTIVSWARNTRSHDP